MIRVILADDHQIVRQGTRLYLESMGVQVLAEAQNGREAVEQARQHLPDAVIMDINMPELSGIEATRRIRHELADVRVLILSAYDEPAYVQGLLDAGADGFVLKTAALSQLLAALKEIVTGHRVFDGETLRRAAAHRREAASVEALTERERQVLQAACHGQTNKEIGQELFISDRTVQGHLQNIYQKLGVTTRTEAVTVALAHNFIQTDTRNR